MSANSDMRHHSDESLSLRTLFHTATSQALWMPMNMSSSDAAPMPYMLDAGRRQMSSALEAP